MTRVAVSGAGGRMGRLVAGAVSAAPDLELGGLFDPGSAGVELPEGTVSGDAEVVAGSDVVVEFTRPEVVMDNLETWRRFELHAVVGTSGFDESRLQKVRSAWGSGPPNCLIVPNFSLGAVLMMRFAELAAPHFAAAEVVELHHDRKVDAPSGTATATAERVGRAQPHQTRAVESVEHLSGSRGGDIGGVRVHSVRLPGLLAHQELILGNQGEILTIRHDSTDLVSFLPGILAAIRSVGELAGVTVGLEPVLGI